MNEKRNEIDLETVKKEELNDLLRWFYAEEQLLEKEIENQEYHKNMAQPLH